MSSTQRIRFYNSVEEMEDASIANSLAQTPVERIRETVELILRVYNVTRAELAARPRSRRIKFAAQSENLRQKAMYICTS